MLSLKYIVPLFLLVVFVVISTALIVSKSKNANNQFTLIKEAGEVFFKTENSDYQQITGQEVKLDNHTYIKTTTGQAQVILPNGSLISIDKESEMQINFDAQNTNIVQTIGNSWHRVKGLVGQGTYEVETPTAVASIRGTKFLVEVIKQDGIFKSKIGVTEGKVNVGQLRKIDQIKKVENVVEVSGGKTADVEGAEEKGEIKVVEITEDTKQTEWFKRNTNLDKEFDKNVEEEKKQGFSKKENLSEKLIKHFQPEPSLTPPPSGIVPTIFKNPEGGRFIIDQLKNQINKDLPFSNDNKINQVIDEPQRKIESLPKLNQPEKPDENSSLPKIGPEIKGLQIEEKPQPSPTDESKSTTNPSEEKSDNKNDGDIKGKTEVDKPAVEEKSGQNPPGKPQNSRR